MAANIYSIEWQMEKYGLSNEEAIEKIEKIRESIKKGQKRLSDFNYKAMSSKSPEYWIKKGYSEQEANQKAQEQLKNMQNIAYRKKRENPEKYLDSYNTRKEYWIKKGYTEQEAIEKIKKRQAIGSLENFKKRYGEEGEKKWRARQVKWQKTLHDKSEEEQKRINKLKGITPENMIRKWGEIDGSEKYKNWLDSRHYFSSSISQELFFEILKYLEDKENVKFDKHNGEKYIQYENKNYSYDFFYHDKIIEFHGDKFHGNPVKYNKGDIPNPFIDLTAGDIWKLDTIKNNIAKKYYDVLVVWESEYRKNPKRILRVCLKYLNIKI
jgi:hypothetical protein